MSATENKWLTIRKGVVVTPVMMPVIEGLEPFFAAREHAAEVTSGVRNPLKQLSIIQHEAEKRDIDREFPEIITADLTTKHFIDIGAGPVEVYEWQAAWSRLLQLKVMISPIQDAAALFDYEHPSQGHIKAGSIRKATEHYCLSPIHPFDIGGAANGIKDELEILEEAIESGEVEGIVDYLIERENNALHIRCQLKGT